MRKQSPLVILLLMFASGVAYADLPQAPLSCDLGTLNAKAPAETKQFAFLVGNYTIHLHAWRNEQWTPPQPGVTARWNGRFGLGGMAIYDEWFNPDPAQDPGGNWGVNVRMFDPEEKLWKMMWIATSGKVVQDLRAEMRDGVLTMWQVYPENQDFKAIFNVTDSDHWERVSFIHDEEGNWIKQYKLAATRMPCK